MAELIDEIWKAINRIRSMEKFRGYKLLVLMTPNTFYQIITKINHSNPVFTRCDDNTYSIFGYKVVIDATSDKGYKIVIEVDNG